MHPDEISLKYSKMNHIGYWTIVLAISTAITVAVADKTGEFSLFNKELICTLFSTRKMIWSLVLTDFTHDWIAGPSQKIICPVNTKSMHESSNSQFKIEDADLNLCSHVIVIDQDWNDAEGEYYSITDFEIKRKLFISGFSSFRLSC